MARGNVEGIIWLDDFAFIPKNIGISVRSTGSAKLIAMPTANTETKFMSKLINLQLLEHNNKERIKKLVRCCAYDGE